MLEEQEPKLTEQYLEEERLPLPPVLTWEEMEQGKAGQLGLPGITPTPTIAERAFLVLAREWLAEIERLPQKHRISRSIDILALSCLLLAVEWGMTFTEVACGQMEINRQASSKRKSISWMDELSWKLCQSVELRTPKKSDAVLELTANLDHHNSSIRCWMMEIAWFVTHWLDPSASLLRLLKNLADTLLWPFMAAGLAARFFEKAVDFIDFAKKYKLDKFEDQYQDRLTFLERAGTHAVQAEFFRVEALCRKEIERAVLGIRFVRERDDYESRST